MIPATSYINYNPDFKTLKNPLDFAINLMNHIIETAHEEEPSVYSDLSSDSYQLSNSIQVNCLASLDESTIENNSYVKWIDDASVNYIKKEISLDTSSEKEKKNKLNSYLAKLKPSKAIIDIPDYSIFEVLVKKTPNFKEALDYFKGCFILNHFKMQQRENYQAPLPILLLGDPGIGKTFFAKELAKSLKTSSYIVDANSISANWVLTGASGQWKSAEAGLIFKQMLDSPTISPIIIFDEIDKLSEGKSYDSFSTFHQLLEPENAKTLKDEFLGCSFDASHIIYILTANDSNVIPASLLSRMKVIHINKPDIKTTHMIAQNIYSSIIGKSDLFKAKLTRNQLAQIEKMTPREIKQLLTNCVYSQTAQIDMSNIEKVKKNQTLIIKKEKEKRPFGIVSSKYNT